MPKGSQNCNLNTDNTYLLLGVCREQVQHIWVYMY